MERRESVHPYGTEQRGLFISGVEVLKRATLGCRAGVDGEVRWATRMVGDGGRERDQRIIIQAASASAAKTELATPTFALAQIPELSVKFLEGYDTAINDMSSDATVLSNRNLCWARLNEGSRALSDAEACIMWSSDWAKAHDREGVAWRRLKNPPMAAEAFSEALKLDPENKELQVAFRFRK
ncbi:hypothetical protein Acr_13g0002480 [Actinidia rufa]|uniref:Tetratricopeptide repeat (TPR)-like superfamily protein n=1 Tax=Actinidia rufa TaxID=165716 RepID=A0A7J0FLN8_9ERIC|nr:hypothetical protein Acr_13g0002480 [Actinidia rufa]